MLFFNFDVVVAVVVDVVVAVVVGVVVAVVVVVVAVAVPAAAPSLLLLRSLLVLIAEVAVTVDLYCTGSSADRCHFRLWCCGFFVRGFGVFLAKISSDY